MKIYTRRGDQGDTGLFGGRRVRKSVARVEAYGCIDELNSVLGVAATFLADDELRAIVYDIQNALFNVGADLATPRDTQPGEWRIPRIGDDDVQRLEALIDRLQDDLEPLRSFILPGGHPAAAHLHLARAVCRRAERRAVAAVDSGEDVSPAVLKYLNRLSDLLFVLARTANRRSGYIERPWEKPAVD